MRKQDMGNQFSKKTRKKAGSIQAQRIFRSRWFKSLVAMGSAVVFFTVYSLIIPAATLTEDQAAADSGIVLEEPAPSEPQVVEKEEAPAPEPAPEEAPKEKPVAQAAVEETPAAASEETAAQTPAEETGTAPSAEQGTSESAAAGSGSEATKEPGTKDDAPADTADLNQTASAVDTTETASDGIKTEEADAALTEKETAEDAATESSEESAEETTEEEEEIGTVSELKAASGNLEALVRFADGAGIPENASLVIYGAGADTGKVQDALWSGSMDSIERSSITTDLSEYVSFAVKDADGNDITPDSDCSIEISFGSEANLSDPGENRIRKYGSLVVSSDGNVSVTGTDLSTGNGHTYATFTGTLSGNTFGFAVTTADRKVNYLESLSGKTSDGAVEAALSFGKDAKVPEGSSLTVETASVNESSVLDKFWGDEEGVNRDTAKADDIRFVKFVIRDRNGNEVRPETRVSVKLTFHHEADLSEAAEGFVKKHNALAAGSDGTIALGSGALSAGNGITTVSFADVSAKSAFGYAVTTAEKKIVYATKLTGKSEDGSIEASLRLTEEAKIPEGSILKVTPVTGESVRKTLLDNIWTDTSIIDPDTIKLTDSGLATVTITDKDGKVRKPEADAVLTLTFNKKADLAEAARKMVKRARAVEMTEENVKLSDSGLSVAEGKTRISYTGIVDGQTFGYAVSTAKQKTNFLDGKLSYEGEDYTIEVSVSKDNQIPENSKLNVKELDKDSEEFKKKLDQATEAIQKDAEKKSSDDIETSVDDASVRMFDITILNEDGDEIQPNGNVRVSVQYKNAVKVGADAKMKAVHFDEKNDEVQVLTPETKADTSDTEKKVHEVRFNANGFSVYAIVGTETIVKDYVDAHGDTYTITVTYTPEANIPENALLEVSEITSDQDQYAELYEKAFMAVKEEQNKATPYARFFDISIVSGGKKIQPAVPVDVTISFKEAIEAEPNAQFNAVHITEIGTDVIPAVKEKSEEDTVTFTANGFSIYGVTYTVDFLYKNYNFSIPGESSILLSNLFEYIGIEADVSEVIGVEFSSPELLEVIKEENDWILKSLAPFDTEETLTVTMQNGLVFTIDVTDAIDPNFPPTIKYNNRSYTISGNHTSKDVSYYIQGIGQSAVLNTLGLNNTKVSEGTIYIQAYKKGSSTIYLVTVEPLHGVLENSRYSIPDPNLIDIINGRASNADNLVTYNTYGCAVGQTNTTSSGSNSPLTSSGTGTIQRGKDTYIVFTDNPYSGWARIQDDIVYRVGKRGSESDIPVYMKIKVNYVDGEAAGNSFPSPQTYLLESKINGSNGTWPRVNMQPFVGPDGTNIPKWEGHQFTGWKVTASEDENIPVGTVYSAADLPATVHNNVTFEAQWSSHSDKKVTVSKIVNPGTGVTADEVDQTIYIALYDQSSDTYLADGDGHIIYKEIVITDGTPAPVSVEFDGLSATRYSVREFVEVDGEKVNALHSTFVADGNLIELSGITGYNTDEGGNRITDSDNDADMANADNAWVVFENTYTTEDEPRTLTVSKRWMKNGADITDTITDATATFTLYRAITDGEDVEVTSVTLDGSVDEPEEGVTDGEFTAWAATFSDYPARDDSGNKYTYKVRETACTPEDYLPYANPGSESPMTEEEYKADQGTIYNKYQKTSITVKKEDDKNNFIPGAVFELYQVVTDDSDASHDVLIQEFTVNEEAGYSIPDLISGDYKLREKSAPGGYVIIDSPIEFHVDAIGNSVITWPDGTKPDNVKNMTTTNVQNDTFTVINKEGHELPSTGGSGTLPYTLGGIALIMASALMYGFRMRRRERRLN